MSYFSSARVQKALNTAGNTDLENYIAEVQFYVKIDDTHSITYPNLFYITDAMGNAPLANSLYNITTLKAIFAAGVKTVDISVVTDMTVEDFKNSINVF